MATSDSMSTWQILAKFMPSGRQWRWENLYADWLSRHSVTLCCLKSSISSAFQRAMRRWADEGDGCHIMIHIPCIERFVLSEVKSSLIASLHWLCLVAVIAFSAFCLNAALHNWSELVSGQTLMVCICPQKSHSRLPAALASLNTGPTSKIAVTISQPPTHPHTHPHPHTQKEIGWKDEKYRNSHFNVRSLLHTLTMNE